ncbi:MAG: WecB/TagA/CpsF family glycosyltransferase [Deltaproteobacteria bacterium]|nr:WecB/TagA/CpsF family glycosyltransferase [Deltaproteobacteria bacterium]
MEILEKRKPKYVLINIGGGTQEKLGLFLKKNLSYKPGIICNGAAIAFLTEKQVSIPTFFDAFYMGWLLKCL